MTLRGTGGSFPAPPRDKSLRYKDFGVLSNDLEDPVLQGWPDLRRYRDALADRGALRAMISGSGSCIFGLFGGAAEARRATEGMSGEFPEWTSQSIQAVRRAAHVEEGGSSA